MSTLTREVVSAAPIARAAGRALRARPRISVIRLLCGWYRRAAARRQLARLNDHYLRDIGLSRADVDPRAVDAFQDRATWSRRLLP